MDKPQDFSLLNQVQPSSSSTSFLSRVAEVVSNSSTALILNSTWTPVIKLIRGEVIKLLQKIKTGKVLIRLVDGTEIRCGSSDPNVDPIILSINDDKFWVRIALYSDLGLAESFMLEECLSSDLSGFLKLLVINRDFLASTSTTLASTAFNTLTYLANTKFVNSINNTLNNISAHYDLGNDMFSHFLDPSLTYSCPIWERVSNSGVNPDLTLSLDQEFDMLYQAQVKKLTTIIKRAKLTKDDHLLEIGSGWGSLAIEAVKQTGCRVTTLTLSIEQKALADVRIAAAGLSDRIKVKLMDYRDLKTQGIIYDKIISIEMLEAVGPEFLSIYFDVCNSVLKKDGGIMVFQVITLHENRYPAYCQQVDFIQKYIFPGGHTPSISSLSQAILQGSSGDLVLDHLENIGGHYVKALRLWSQRFLDNFDKIKLYDPKKYTPIFRRTWQYYFAYCEAGFATHCLGDVIVTLTRPNNFSMLDGIPL